MTGPTVQNPSRPARVQRQRRAGWRMPPGVVYVGRPTRWGNPWRVEELGATEAVARYRADLLADPGRVTEVRRELGGRDLACWCRLDAVCHADVLLSVANASHGAGTGAGPGPLVAAVGTVPGRGRARFFLGTHQPGWLGVHSVPLFVSDRRLRRYKRLPRARVGWSLDSGGFTELAAHGSWAHGPTVAEYAARVRRYATEVGNLSWAAPMDWMCEPFMLARTGLTVAEHQARTVANLLDLRAEAPDVAFAPVVQGWSVADYLRCVDAYAAAGVDLRTEPVVAVGSVCRRQATDEIGHVMTALHEVGVTKLHGLGVKLAGLRRYGHLLTSADSMAWSVAARRAAPMAGCVGHRNCANCSRWALRWRAQVEAGLDAPPPAEQLGLFTPPEGVR